MLRPIAAEGSRGAGAAYRPRFRRFNGRADDVSLLRADMRRTRPLGIFCVEGDWSPKLTTRASVRELLEMLQDVAGIDFIHHHVETVDGLFDVLRRWGQKQYARYALGYFAFHGKPGSILVGRRSVTLRQLGEALNGRASGKILYFGSCSVLRAPGRELNRFCAVTGSPCIVGFTRDVDWIASAALDLILLQAIAVRKDPDAVRRWLDREFGDFATHLGLRVY